ncbi:MAG: hypothetical protein TREMPRED_003329 [Tremellales sp. Tagirdzhanova-0007]|nr:MAG: hypothetical protein TREMPRED_003329 [Tremellales sp. Tagirdzhanova-0007]
MSTPEASETRQRTNRVSGQDDDAFSENPASLGGHSKQIPRNKPKVKPPLSDISMSRFLTYMVFGLLALSGFYVWRVTVWAAEAGGYWALVTGHHHPQTQGSGVGDYAVSAAASAASARASSKKAKKPAGGSEQASGSEDDVESQIFHLANALGIKPAELTAAIRPLIDPSVPNPAEAAKLEADVLKQQIAVNQADANHEEEHHGSLLGTLSEALLD